VSKKESDFFVLMKENAQLICESSLVLKEAVKDPTTFPVKMKELIEGTPRKGLMVLRNKACKRSSNDVEDYEEDGDEEEEDRNLHTRNMRHRREFGQYSDPVLIMDSEGNRVKSMTEFIHGENR
jgi:hypothetical protein